MKTKFFALIMFLIIPIISHATDIQLGAPSYGGTGCPAGTASIGMSADGTVGIYTDEFTVEAGGASGRSIGRKSCNIAFPISVPQGFSVAMSNLALNGYVSLPSRATARLTAEMFFAGSRGPRFTKNYRGPYDGDLNLNTSITPSALQWSRCGQDANMRANVSMMVRNQNRSTEAMAIMDGMTPSISFNILWKRCGGPIPVKTFLDYCTDADAKEDIKHTVAMLQDVAGSEDCQEAFDLLKEMEKLDLKNKEITDIKALVGLNKLKQIQLGANAISDLAPLKHLPALEKLAIYANKVTSLSPLANSTALTYLNAGANDIVDLTPLKEMKALKTLALSKNAIVDLTPLEELTQLTHLYLRKNQITDIAPLAGLLDLSVLSVKGNEIVKDQNSCPSGEGISSAVSNFCEKYLLKETSSLKLGQK
ncbi:MAG: DUF4360 domain-containing protein [Bacteriovoracaceae bacterium]|nr:DUF4360 domain-containing protein [Bacteriovoracaceae bacterium]